MNNPTRRNPSHDPPWTLDDIKRARAAMLAPILVHKGYAVLKLPNGAVLLRNFRGLIIHGNRWTWKSEHMYGNTLDFFITVEGKTFSQAMEILCNSAHQECDPQDQPEDETPFL